MGYLSDNKNNKSSMRLMACFIVLCVMVIWAAICYNKKEFLPFDQTHIWLIGVVLFGKTVSGGLENGQIKVGS